MRERGKNKRAAYQQHQIQSLPTQLPYMREVALDVYGNQNHLRPSHPNRLILPSEHDYRSRSLLPDQTMFPARCHIVWANGIVDVQLPYLSHRLEQSASDGLLVGQGYLCDKQGTC